MVVEGLLAGEGGEGYCKDGVLMVMVVVFPPFTEMQWKDIFHSWFSNKIPPTPYAASGGGGGGGDISVGRVSSGGGNGSSGVGAVEKVLTSQSLHKMGFDCVTITRGNIDIYQTECYYK